MREHIEWPVLEAALDRLLDVPQGARRAALTLAASGDPALRHALERLLGQIDRPQTWFDHPQFDAGERMPAEPPGLAPGQRVDAYRVVELLGRGGMGEVYLADRADGHFEQRVAIKVIRRDAVGQLERFHTERQILARLDHPGITRIHGGGMLESGQAYMVMELVNGLPITEWCRQHAASLERRLGLFVAVCEAVAYAHRNLIVHRDLKPSNVLVTQDGQVKLLDFGVAKPLAAPAASSTFAAPFTPDYAAPEQLTGGMISTATDVYALGLLLYELLAGALPWRLAEMPLADGLHVVLHRVPDPPSRLALAAGEAPVPAKALPGDLDAIVGKAVRKEPQHRYPTVDALLADIERYRQAKPVSARAGSRLYVARRFLRRHRLPAASLAVILLAVLGGLGGISWQYLRAEHQATRAGTIKDFLVRMFTDADPDFPAGKARNEVTASQLMDLGVRRIDREFAGDPRLKAELFGISAQIYDGLTEKEKKSAVQAKQVAAEQTAYGDHSSIVINDIIEQASSAMDAQKWALMNQYLDKADRLLRESGRDDSVLRAKWWFNKGESLTPVAGTASAQLDAYEHAIALYERYDRSDENYFGALENAGTVRINAEDYAGAASFYEKARAVLPKDIPPDDFETFLTNQAEAHEILGNIDGASAEYGQAAASALLNGGPHDVIYWYASARRARLVHQQGDRIAAMAMFAALLKNIPDHWTQDTYDSYVKLIYAQCLDAEGRASLALPLLQQVEAALRSKPMQAGEIRRVLTALADSYDQTGHTDEARAAFSAALPDFAAHAPDTPEALRAKERWGRFLLDHGELQAADSAFDAVASCQAKLGALTEAPALALGGKARVALAKSDITSALSLSEKALAALGEVRALHDNRARPRLLAIRAAVLRAAGQTVQASAVAERAVADWRRMAVPDAAVIAEAVALEGR